MDVPMLNEVEFRRIREAELLLIHRHAQQAPTADSPRPADTRETQSPLQRILDLYHEMTGWRETNAAAVMHHRLALYGPPCHACGKPFRSPQAHFCAACGVTRIDTAPRS